MRATCAEKIAAVMGAEDRMYSPAELVRTLALPHPTVRKALQRMVKAGTLANPIYGSYHLADRPVPLVRAAKSLGTRVVELEAEVARLRTWVERVAVAMDDHTHPGSTSPPYA